MYCHFIPTTPMLYVIYQRQDNVCVYKMALVSLAAGHQSSCQLPAQSTPSRATLHRGVGDSKSHKTHYPTQVCSLALYWRLLLALVGVW